MTDLIGHYIVLNPLKSRWILIKFIGFRLSVNNTLLTYDKLQFGRRGENEKRTEGEIGAFAAIYIRENDTAGGVCDFDCYWFHFEQS